ncbi:DUF3618 domain-containing protein [Jonesia quinghaiensis]|uniref:DUF3618 domain-containing protein n=1 Tax=Jonesia quinghaiensis TaxID=262806 RepID=UPI0004021715|nr:DUF3618 domain-containing protein [Jonesia quinghaiensis]
MSRNPSDDAAEAREELASLVDELMTRLSPSSLAAQAGDTARQTGEDIKEFVTTRDISGDTDGSRARNVKIALGAGAAAVGLIALKIIRK